MYILSTNLRSYNSDHLDKIFDHTRAEMLNVPLNHPSRRREPRDSELELLEAKAAVRTEESLNKAQAAKQASFKSRLIDNLTNSDEDIGPVVQNTPRSRNTRSSTSVIEVENEKQRQLKHTVIETTTFYGSTNPSQAIGNSERRSSTRLTSRDTESRQPVRNRSRSLSPSRWTELNPDWSKEWKTSIIYPKEGKNRATVDMQDIERLDEGQFLNDSLINFYLRWLEQRLSERNPALHKRIYFHNTFFYKTLTTLSRGHRGINYEAVERWTARVDLLSYDYIIVPVNENTHWYVAIICNAPKLLPGKPEVSENTKTPQDDSNSIEKIIPENGSKSSRQSLSSPQSTLAQRSEQQDIAISEIENLSLKESKGNSSPEADPKSNDVAGMASEEDISVNSSHEDSAKRDFSKERPTMLTDQKQAPSKKLSPGKRGKRKSVTSAPRKHDPKEPRIITLDSLGVRHSPTCTNLRDYIVAEIKSKRGIEIPSPGPLGTTAMNIPGQTNFCDCGLFLLSYVEKFLENPDDFIHDILQNTRNLDADWPIASDMRCNIRELLLHLQNEQVMEANDLRRMKSLNKKNSPDDNKAKINTHPNSQEMSKKDTRNSSIISRPDEEGALLPQSTSRSSPEPSTYVGRKRLASRGDLNPADPKRSRQEASEVLDPPATGEEDLRSNAHDAFAVSVVIHGNTHNKVSKRTPNSKDAFALPKNKEKSSDTLRKGESKPPPLKTLGSPMRETTRYASPHTERSSERGTSLVSPSPEEVEKPKLSIRDRQSTPFAQPEDVFDSDFESGVASGSSQSSTLDEQYLPKETPSGTIQISDDDDEMLFRGSKQSHRTRDHSVSLLSSSDLSPTTVRTTSPVSSGKRRKTQLERALPTQKQINPPVRGRDYSEKRRPRPLGGDASDTAVVGKHGAHQTKLAV